MRWSLTRCIMTTKMKMKVMIGMMRMSESMRILLALFVGIFGAIDIVKMIMIGIMNGYDRDGDDCDEEI